MRARSIVLSLGSLTGGARTHMSGCDRESEQVGCIVRLGLAWLGCEGERRRGGAGDDALGR